MVESLHEWHWRWGTQSRPSCQYRNLYSMVNENLYWLFFDVSKLMFLFVLFFNINNFPLATKQSMFFNFASSMMIIRKQWISSCLEVFVSHLSLFCSFLYEKVSDDLALSVVPLVSHHQSAWNCQGAEKVADALKENRTLTTIDLVWWQDVASKCVLHLYEMTTCGTNCFVTLQGGNNIHEKGAAAIAQVLKDNDIVTTVIIVFSLLFWCVSLDVVCPFSLEKN